MATLIDGETLLPGVIEPEHEPRSPSPALVRRSPNSIRPLIALLILVHLSAVLYTLPLNRVIEFRLCEDYYRHHDPELIPGYGAIPEKLCKVDEVQRRLAWLQGVMETTLVVCGAHPQSYLTSMLG